MLQVLKNLYALRILAAVSVLCLHYSGGLYQTEREDFTSVFGALMNGFARVCVPVFFILSGYFRSKRVVNLRDLKKYLFLATFFSLFYFVFDFIKTCYLGQCSFNLVVQSFPHYHLWFIWSFISILIAVSLSKINLIDFNPFILFGSIAYTIGFPWIKFEYSVLQYIVFLPASYFSFFYIGRFFHEYDDLIKSIFSPRRFLLLTFFFLLGVFNSFSFWYGFDYFLYFHSPNIFIFSVLAFAIFFTSNVRFIISESIFSSSGLLFLYFIHPFFIEILRGFGIKVEILGFLGFIFWGVFIFMLCFLSYLVLYKVPVVKKIVCWD